MLWRCLQTDRSRMYFVLKIVNATKATKQATLSGHTKPSQLSNIPYSFTPSLAFGGDSDNVATIIGSINQYLRKRIRPRPGKDVFSLFRKHQSSDWSRQPCHIRVITEYVLANCDWDPDKKIRGMAQQGLCHPKFAKCVQHKQSDWSDFKGSSKQAI